MVRPQGAKQTTLLGSQAKLAQQGQQVNHSAAGEAGSVDPAGKQQAASKAQVAKDYIGQLRRELPAASFRSAGPFRNAGFWI